MKKLNMLAIDLGASSGRGIVGGFDGKRLTLDECHRFTNDPVMAGGRFYWDVLRILHEIKQAIRNAAKDGGAPLGMGIDTWGVDYGLLDKNGRLMGNPVHYRDTRTRGMAAALEDRLPRAELYRITGIQSIDFNTVYQLAAEQRDDAARLAAADALLFTPDLLNYFLTGKRATEYTIASTGALLDAATGEISAEVLQKLGLPAGLFAKTVRPGNCLGGFSAAVKEELGGIDMSVFNVAAHDTASAVLSVPAEGEDFVYISSGTWSLMGTELKKPLINDDTMAANFTNEGGAFSTIRFLKNIMGLWILQESRRQWKREGREIGFGEMSAMAEREAPFRSLINPDDSLFATPGDMPRRIAEYCKKTGQPVPESVGEIVRTVVDSLALRYRYTMEKITALRDRAVPAIHVVGGGTKDTLLCRMTANVCGVPVIAGPTEATAIGNLCMQYVAAGELAGLADVRALVRESFSPVLYQPAGERAACDEAFARFCQLCGE